MSEEKETIAIVQTTVRMPQALKKALADEVHRRKFTRSKISFDRAIQEGIALWLESAKVGHEEPQILALPSTEDAAVIKIVDRPRDSTRIDLPLVDQVGHVSKEELAGVRGLLRVLRDGPPQAKNALLQNIMAFSLLTDYTLGVRIGGSRKIPKPVGDKQDPYQAVVDAEAEARRRVEELERPQEPNEARRSGVAAGAQRHKGRTGGGG